MRRWLVITLSALAGLLAVVVIAVAGGLVWLNSGSGRDVVLRMATDAAKDSGLSLALNGVDGELLGVLTIAEATIDDQEGRWLTARNLKLSWHPWQLVHGRLHVAELSAESIDLPRAPNLPPGEAQPSEGGMPSLPVEIALDKLGVGRIDLGEALAGLAASLSLDAHAAAARHAGNLGLQINRLDAPGSIALDARFDVPRDALALALHVDEPSGGLLSHLIDREGKPAVQASLTGDGPLSDWRGTLLARIDNADWLALAASVEGRDTRTIGFDGMVNTQPFAKLMPEGLAPLIGPEITLSGKTVIDAKQARIEMLDIGSDGAALSLSGAYRLGAGDWNAAANLTRLSPALAAHFGIVADQPAVAAEARSARGATNATLRVTADRFETQGMAIAGLNTVIEAAQSSASAPWQIAVTGDGQVAALPGEPTPASDQLLGPFALNGKARVEASGAATLDDLHLTLGPATLTASGRYGEDRADGKLALDVTDLTPFVPGAVATEPMAARLATSLRYGAADGLTLNDFALDLPGGQIAGQVSLDAAFEKIEAAIKTAGFDIAPLGKLFGAPLAGRLTLNASATGATADPAVKLQAHLQNGSVEGNALPPAELRADVAAAVSAPAGNVALTLRPPQGLAVLSTRFAMPNPNMLNLSAIKLEGPGVQGNGQIRLALDRMLASGQFKLDAANLTPLLTIAGLGGGGSAKIDLSLSAANNQQQADVTGSIASLIVSQGGEDLARIGRAELAAKGALGGKTPVNAKLTAENIVAAGAEIRRVTLDARGTADQITFGLRTAAPAYQDLELSLDGTFSTKNNERTIRLTKGGGSLRKQPFTVQPGMTAVIAPESYELRGFKLTGRAFGETSIDGSLKKTAIDAKVNGRGIPLALLSDPASEDKTLGQIDVAATASGTIARPLGQVNLVARDVALAGDRLGGKSSAKADLTVDDKAANLQISLTNLASQPLTASASVARTPKGLGFDENSALTGRLAWNGAITEITKFAPLVGQDISGHLASDLALSGSLGKPGVAGTVTLSDGKVEDYSTGLVLRFPRLEIVGDTRRLELRPFEALDPSGGKIAGRATVTLDSAAGFPFTGQLDFSRARVLNRDDIMAILSGNVGAEGSLQTAMIRGSLQSERVEVNLDTGLPPSVVTLEVEEIPADGSGGPRQQATVRSTSKDEGGASNVQLDVKLTMPGRVFVRGRGLDSEWEGNIAVAGSATSPRVTGQLTSRRGQFDLIGKIFRVQPSTIDLAPTADGGVDALLNIKAVNSANDLEVTVAVTGTGNSPKIGLSSNPSLPQDEILARLLFGKNRASLTPLEAVQLAQALQTLSGGGGGLDIMAKLRGALGVDVLRVDSGTSSGTGSKTGPSLEAGKYITDKVYVGVKQGASQGTSAVTIDVDVLQNMSVGSEVRQDGSNRVGVKYKWDY